MAKYLSRKFAAAVVVIGVASTALFMGKLDGSSWLAAANLALTLYLSANVVQKAVVGNASSQAD